MTRSVEIPEEMVEKANKAYWDVFGSERLIAMNDAPAEEAIAMRAALEAAFQHLEPAGKTSPVADWARLDDCAAASAQMIQWHAPETYAALVEAAVPQPVDRQALADAITGPNRDWLSRHLAYVAADRVLALLAGEQEQAQ